MKTHKDTAAQAFDLIDQAFEESHNGTLREILDALEDGPWLEEQEATIEAADMAHDLVLNLMRYN